MNSERASCFWRCIKRVLSTVVGRSSGKAYPAIVSKLCPDQHGVTDCVPESWTAADASNFLLRRPDRLAFLSMWGCLWSSAEGGEKRMRQRILDWVRDGQFVATSRRLRDAWGVTPHPAKVVAALKEADA